LMIKKKASPEQRSRNVLAKRAKIDGGINKLENKNGFIDDRESEETTKTRPKLDKDREFL